MRRIVTNEVTTSQGFDARRRNEGRMVGGWGLDFKEDPCQGPEDILVFENMTDRLRAIRERREVNMKIRTAERRMTVNTSP